MSTIFDFDSNLLRELDSTSRSQVIELLPGADFPLWQIAKPGVAGAYSSGYQGRIYRNKSWGAWVPQGLNMNFELLTLQRAARGLTLEEANASEPPMDDWSGVKLNPPPPCCWNETLPVPVRTLWSCKTLSSRQGMDGRERAPEESATLISSLLEGDENHHAPVLDFDFPCRLVPSTTPGHFHFYIDTAVTWKHYKRMLVALSDVGLIQQGFADNSIARQQTMVIREGLTKEDLAKRGVQILTDSSAPPFDE